MQAEKARKTRAERHADIRRAAIEEFAQHGFRGASTQSIAQRAGLSKSQLHYYIESKEALYREVLLGVTRDWSGFFEPDRADEGPAPVLTRYIRRKLEFSFADPLRTKIFTAELLAGAPYFKPLLSTIRRRTDAELAVVRRWIERGQMRALDPLQFMMNLWAITQFYADHEEQVRLYMKRRTLSDDDREHIISHVTTVVLAAAGVLPEPSRRTSRAR